MRNDVKTCPDCGALITPQLTTCRQCGRYLHGTKLEGILFQHLLPEALRSSPGTGLLMLGCGLYYVLMTMFAGIDNVLGFTTFTLSSLGAVTITGIIQGEYWRFVTSIFGHHDVLHIAFNLSGLAAAGRLVEEAFDKKKMMIIYLVSGVGSMAASYVWYRFVWGELAVVTAGASGAVCGMIGAALVAGKRLMHAQATEVKKAMIRWTVYMAIWGFVGSINNAAHVSGWLIGAGLAYVIPLGLTQSVSSNRILSVVVLSMLAGVAYCGAEMLLHLRGFPASLDHDYESRGVLFFTYAEGTDYQFSSQVMLRQQCEDLLAKDPLSDDTVRQCELALRANGYILEGHVVALLEPMAQIHAKRGEVERAEALRRTLLALVP